MTSSSRACGMFLYASYKRPLPAGALDDAGSASMGIGIVATLAMIGVGAALGVTRRRGWRPPPVPERERPPSGPRSAPRLDAEWVKDDRMLRGATIGLATLSVVAAVSIPLTFKFIDPVVSAPPCNEPTGCNTPPSVNLRSGVAVTAEIVGLAASLAALTAVGATWSVHRQPLRRWKLAPTAGGLQIQF